jgi:uncharacterized membrane protein SirB2
VIEYYATIRAWHIGLAIATGLVFALRGVLVQTGYATAAHHIAVRYLSYTIDTSLLTAALMLLTMLNLSPLRQAWLTVKILLLVAYIVFGWLALRREQTANGRTAAFAVALLCYITMLGVARAHDPRGWWVLLR